MTGGIVSATLLPTRRIASLSAMSVIGNGSPRSTPKAASDAVAPRGHAEAAVVVDLRRAQPDPCELAQQVDLLVRQAAAAEQADGVQPVRGLNPANHRDRWIQGFIPGRGSQHAAAAIAHQRRAQSFRAVDELPGGPALLAEAATVGGKVTSGGTPLAGSVSGQMHPALERAVRAMCRAGAALEWRRVNRCTHDAVPGHEPPRGLARRMRRAVLLPARPLMKVPHHGECDADTFRCGSREIASLSGAWARNPSRTAEWYGHRCDLFECNTRATPRVGVEA